MRTLAASAAISGAALVILGAHPESRTFGPESTAPVAEQRLTTPPAADLSALVDEYCVRCHSDRRLSGNLSLEGFDVAGAHTVAPTTEKMIVKLRAGMMPPAGSDRPGGDSLQVLVQELERIVDEAAARAPNAGSRVFQRLNRAEYERSVLDLLEVDVDAGTWLPLDTKSANFDNIADVQLPSATLMDAYLTAAAEISRLAVGYAKVTETTTAYKVPRMGSQLDRESGAPRGTRGGMSVEHFFPADGEYTFAMEFHATPTGELYGRAAPFDEHIEVSVDGVRVALLPIDRWSTDADPGGLIYRTEPIQVSAGPHQVASAFIRTFEGPVNDNLTPMRHSIVDTQIGQEYGINNETHLRDLFITGPFNVTGVSTTPSREKIFTCRPLSRQEAQGCAEDILGRIATEAYRRPLRGDDLAGLMTFYRIGDERGGFEEGVRMGLQAILASPHFVFRMEELPQGAQPGRTYAVASEDLAARLSFFLWGAAPDAELLDAARGDKLQNRDVLLAQARRMLDDSRSEALATRFAAQWLRLQDLEKIHPDALDYPHFDLQLEEDMLKETELFFNSVVSENRSLFDLFNADYTFVNERLAWHYGFQGISGENFRRITYPTPDRRGIFGHASILTLTSHANRTSPVMRGKWVMEVILGTPPPPPPPNVPPLEESVSASTDDGTPLTTSQRMQLHRANPTCNSCHRLIDPIGIALENFDVTGAWRIRENGAPVDVGGQLYDGTPLASPTDLREALMRRPEPIVRNFTKNLMAYALGRRVEYYDMPTIRQISREASKDDYRMRSIILGVVASDAFRMQSLGGLTTEAGNAGVN